ncbi:MAG: RnfABCDGE type electron transport complex subunit D [Pirellulales bacterium]|nr:RnfABCDGE type electron transport complex subunit D [Pirellulales bacterium]
MPENTGKNKNPASAEQTPIRVGSSPHLSAPASSTHAMMVDVLVGLLPVMVMAVVVFRWSAVVEVGLCVLACLASEWLLNLVQKKPQTLGDFSAVVTGLLLGLSLPSGSSWYICVIGSVVAIGIGKAAFGGLGMNLFNPAMVGRAFVMLSFASQLGASAYVVTDSDVTVLSQATPLTIAKQYASDLAAGREVAGNVEHQLQAAEKFWPLFIGQVNGSLGETSAIALLLGGIYMCLRRAAAWQIPLGALLAGFVCAALARWTDLTPFTALRHLISGSFLLGAFFIATDPVTSPISSLGKFIFGLGVGIFTVLIRLFSGYPEGVMFAVLLMNAAVPLIDRWAVPKPMGAG